MVLVRIFKSVGRPRVKEGHIPNYLQCDGKQSLWYSASPVQQLRVSKKKIH
jgi:hypothetical protein